MPRKCSPERDRARQLYVDSGGKVTLRELARVMNVPEKSLSVWKRREQWDELVKTMDRAKTQSIQTPPNPEPPEPRPIPLTQKGAPAKRPDLLGNQLAAGNRGGPGAQPGNQLTLKHGLYANLLLNCTDEERAILERTPTEPLERQRALIEQCEIRERRMYLRLEAVCQKYDIAIGDGNDGMMPVHEVYTAYLKKSKEAPNGGTVTRTKQNAITVILAIEEALTRLQKLKLDAINNLDRMLSSKVTLEYERRRLSVIEGRERKQADVEDLTPLAEMLALPVASAQAGEESGEPS